MSNLKRKKYFGFLLIVLLVSFIVLLISNGKVDRYKGLVKVKNAKINSKVLSSVGNLTLDSNEIKGSSVIEYSVNFTLDEVDGITSRDAIIHGSLTNEESRYARFKEVTGNGITSTLIDNGKEIDIKIDDVELGSPRRISLRLVLTNAPNGFSVKPNISVKEATGEYTNLVTSEAVVNTNSIEGIVLDENNLPVSNIEVVIRKNNEDIKKTYTDLDGKYIISDVENGTYELDVDEEIYEVISKENIDVSGSVRKNIVVKQVEPCKIETHKYIEKLDLILDGKEKHYDYNDAEEVVEVIKRANNISGIIEYKLVVSNVGEKRGTITRVIDYLQDGLSFAENNVGWDEVDGELLYRPIEGTVLEKGESKEITLVLKIESTKEAKTYLNKMTTKGEIYERVVYILNGEVYKEEDVIEGDKIIEPTPSVDNFSGWFTDKKKTNKYNFNNPVTKDLILYGSTDEVKYNVEFYDRNPETGNETKWDEQLIKEGEKATKPEDPSHTGYTFDCWMDEQATVWNFNNPVERDLRLTSCYKINEYTVLFMDGSTEYKRQKVEYKESITPVENPTKQYYTFDYWHLEDVDSAYDLTTPVTEDVTLYSKYTRNKHNVTFTDINPSTSLVVSTETKEVKEGEKVTKPTDPSKTGYEFVCWQRDDNSCFNFDDAVLSDENLTSKYKVLTYTIIYKGLTNTEKDSLNNPTTYTVEDTITLTNPQNRKDTDEDLSEIFVGWTGSNGNNPSSNITIAKGSTGNKEYTANWIEADPDIYPIAYNLKEGRLEEGKDNPSSYTKKTNTFTLFNPSKKGYTFTGWSGTDLVGQDNTEVTITKGSRGERSYEAWYTPKNYSIEYINDCGEVNNPSSYTIETDTFTLINPSKTGYEFKGWKTDDSDEVNLNITIEKGSTGNKKYTAVCSPIKYNIIYHLNDGSLEEGKVNPTTYTIESDDITLFNPSKAHYTFDGWSGTGLDNITNQVTIPHGSVGDREYTANYSIITHTVTFKDKDPENPVVDTVVDFGSPKTVNDGDSVTAPESNPEHTGYTCDRWSTKIDGDYNTDAYNFNNEVTGDLTLYTLCKKKSYTVTYMDGENQYATETVLYKEKTTRPSTDPSKAHNLFLGWTKDNNLYDFDTMVIENITLYSSYEAVMAPTITHTPTDWTNQNVTVTIESSHNDYSYAYNIDGGVNIPYIGPFEVEENCTVNAFSIKDSATSVESSHEITNIDKIKPIVDSLEKTSGSFTELSINFSGHDNESGLRQFNIYIDDTYETTIMITDSFNDLKNETYRFTNLEPNTSYKVSIEAIDRAGNVSDRYSENYETDYKIVARIIGKNNVPLAEENYINFSTLRAAIEYADCESTQCTIQMLESVRESNEILEGQDITLDLNGKTVSGVSDYTIRNDGKFTLIDDANEPGELYNGIDTAIINEYGGTLTLGVNETPTDVKATIPNVVGTTYGIYTDNDSTFNYYDGVVTGRVAVQGSVDDTPYLYNADVEVLTDLQVATLKILDDAEARIKSKYYTKVHQAIDDSKKGTVEDTTTVRSYLQDVKSPTTYGFKYENGVLVSENTGISNSTANGFIQIDMVDETEPKNIFIDLTISSEANDKAYGMIKTEYGTPTYTSGSSNNMFEISGEENRVVNGVLYPGKVYYVYFGYVKNGTVDEGSDSLTINSISLSDYTNVIGNADYELLNENSNYNFKLNEDGSLESTNTGEVLDNCFSKFDIDLTNESTDKLFVYSTKINNNDSHSSTSYFRILDESNKNVLDVTLASNNTNKSIILPAGQKYTAKLYYQNYNGSSNAINENITETVSLYDLKLLDVNRSNLSNYTVDSSKNNHSVTLNNDGLLIGGVLSGTSSVTTHLYYEIDGTSFTEDRILNISGLFKIKTNYGNTQYSYLYVYSSDSPTSYTTSDILYQRSSRNNTNYSDNVSVNANIPAGSKKYIHIVFTSNKSASYQSFTLRSLTFLDENGQALVPSVYGDYYRQAEKTANNGIIPVEGDFEDNTYNASLKFDLTNESSKVIYLSGIDNNNSGYYMYANSQPFVSSNTISPLVKYDNGIMYELPGGEISYINIVGQPTINEIREVEITSSQGYSDYEVEDQIVRLNQDVDTVEILKDITLSSNIDIIKERDVVLDLNGYTLSNNTDDYLITNNGSLKVTDNKYSESYDQLVIDTEVKKEEYEDLYNEYKNRVTSSLSDYVQDDLYIQYDAYYGNPNNTNVLEDVKGNNTDVSFFGPTYSNYGYLELYNGQFNVASTNKINIDGSFTVDVTSNVRANSSYTILAFATSTGTYYINTDSYGTWTLYGPGFYGITIGTFPINEVHHTVIEYDKDKLQVYVYIDGKKVSTVDLTNELDNSSSYVYVQGSSAAAMNIYNLSIYKRALSEKEIVKNYYVNMTRYANRTLKDSMINGPSDLTKVIDNDLTTYYENTSSGSYYFNIPNPIKLNTVKLYFDKDYLPANVTLLGSADGNSYSDQLISKSKGDFDENGVLEVPISYTSKYNKLLLVVTPDGSNAFRIKEFEVDSDDFELPEIKAELDTSALDMKKFTTNGKAIIYNAKDANLVVENVKLESTSSSESDAVIENYGNLTLGKEAYVTSENSTGVNNHEYGHIAFDGGNITSKICINNNSYVQPTIDNANMKSSNTIIKQNIDKDLVINNSKFDATTTNVYPVNNSNVTVTFNDSNIFSSDKIGRGNFKLISNNSNIYLNDSYVTLNNNSYYSTSNGSYYTFNVTDSTFFTTYDTVDLNSNADFKIINSRIIPGYYSNYLNLRLTNYNNLNDNLIDNSTLDGVCVYVDSSQYHTSIIKDSFIMCKSTSSSAYSLNNNANTVLKGNNKIGKINHSNSYRLDIEGNLECNDMIYNSASNQYNENGGMYVTGDIVFTGTSSMFSNSGYLEFSGNSSIDSPIKLSNPAINNTGNNSYNITKVLDNFEIKSHNFSNAIAASSSATQVIIGNKDGDVKLSPILRAYGFTVGSGNIKFYDGTLIGPRNSIYGNISDIEDGYSVKKEYDDNYEYDTISNEATTEVAQIGETKYYSLQDAFNDVPSDNTETTIEIIGNISTSLKSELSENKNVVINVNNHTISAINYPFITNKGTMKIVDNNGSSLNMTIVNENNLTLDGVKLDTTSTYPEIKNVNTSSVVNINNNSDVEKVISYNDVDYYIESTININNSNVDFVNDTLVGQGTLTATNSTIRNAYVSNSNLTNTTLNSLNSREEATIVDSTITTANVKDSTITNTNINKLTNTGTSNIYDSTIKNISNERAYSINNAVINIYGGTYTFIENRNYNSNEVNIYDNATISCTNECIKNYKLLNIVSANIESTNTNSSPIIIKSNDSVINIGTKGDMESGSLVVSQSDPSIKGESYAINGYNNTPGDKVYTSVVNFYDGVIKSKDYVMPINGKINDVETNYSIIYEDIDHYHSIYLDYVPVARLESTNIKYYDLKEAFDAITSSTDTVTLLTDLSLPETYQSITIPDGKNITFNVNGNNLTHNNNNLFINNGNLTITDNKNDVMKTGIINNYSSNDIINNGVLVIDNVNITFNKTTELNNTGTVTIKDSNIKHESLSTDAAVYNAAILRSDYYKDIYSISNTGLLTVNNSTTTNVSVNNRNEASLQNNDMSIYINGSLFNNENIMTINRGTYKLYGLVSNYGINGSSIDNEGTLNITNANLTTSGEFINNTGTVTISGGSNNYREAGYSHSDRSYKALINGTVTIDNGSTFRGVLFEADDLTIKDATLEDVKIKINNKLTLGVKDGTVSTTTPKLVNTVLTPVNNQDGKEFNFYDGIITGPHDTEKYNAIQKPIDGLVSDVETDYSIYKDINNNQESKYLTDRAIVKLSSDDSTYLKLSDAINNASSSDTIMFIRDVTIPTSAVVTTINKNVTIDLNGKYIDSDALIIDNKAVVTLKDSTNSGTIMFYDKGKVGIKNSGTLNLETINIEGQVENEGTMDISSSKVTYLLNTGTMNLNTIESKSLINTNTVTMSNNSSNNITKVNNTGTISGYGLINEELTNSGKLNITNSELVKGTSTSNIDVTINNSKISNGITFNYLNSDGLTDSTVTINNEGIINNYNGTLVNNSSQITITNSNFKLVNTGNMLLDSTNTLTSLENSGVITLDGVTSSDITNSNELNLIRSTVNGNITNNTNGVINYDQTTTNASITNHGTLNMNSGSVNSVSTGITNNGTLILGVRDGSVDGSIPSINGTVGVSGNVTAFYDGIITGTTESLSGNSLVLEDNYELKKDTDQGIYRAYLIRSSEGEARVAVVNNINYTSLQGAINACANTKCDIILYANIELDEPVTVAEGADISIYLNYRNIIPEEYVTNHSGTGEIKIVSGIPSGLTGSLYRILADITGSELNPKNIIIYNMEDGNELKENETYKLYKFMDGAYKVVLVNEDELGEYTVGNSKESMNTIKGKLYLNNIGEGSYKLVSNTNREINFEIYEHEVSNNIRENNSNINAKLSSSSTATLILTFATGIIKTPYILIIVLLLAVISLSILVVNKKKQ